MAAHRSGVEGDARAARKLNLWSAGDPIFGWMPHEQQCPLETSYWAMIARTQSVRNAKAMATIIAVPQGNPRLNLCFADQESHAPTGKRGMNQARPSPKHGAGVRLRKSDAMGDET